jgi:hypothetical protein
MRRMIVRAGVVLTVLVTASACGAATPPVPQEDKAQVAAATPPASTAAPAAAPSGDALYDRAAPVALQAGWREYSRDDTRLVLVGEKSPDRFVASVVVERIRTDVGPLNEETCRGIADGMASARDAKVVAAGTTTVGAAGGCRIEIASNSTDQSAVQYALSGPSGVVSVLCNRDKRGDPSADGVCLGVVNAIWAR